MTAQEFLDSIDSDGKALVCRNVVGVLWSRFYKKTSDGHIKAITNAPGVFDNWVVLKEPLKDITASMDIIERVRNE